MKVDVQQVSTVERKLSFEVPWDAVKRELDVAYRDLARRARVKGFRAGKVPRKVLEQFYKQMVEGQVVSQLVDDSFKRAVKDHDLIPIDSPQMDEVPEVKPQQPLAFTARVQVKPEVEVTGYDGLPVEKKIRKVTDAEVDTELNALRDKATVVEQVTDRTRCEDGDLAVVDFFGYVDGETFKGGKGINYTIEVGSGRMIGGFEEQLVGMEIGAQKTFELPFPEDQGPAEVRGKTVEWKVDLKELRRKILPDLDDEFAKDLGEFDTLQELKDNLRQNLATRQDAKSKRQLRDAVMEALVERNSVDVPGIMVDRQLDFLLQDATKVADDAGDEVKAALEKLREEARPRAEKQVLGMLLLEAVSRKEKLDISDAELEGRIQELSREHRIPAKQLKIQLKQNDQVDALRYNLLQDKTLDFLVDRAVVTEREVSEDDEDTDGNADVEGSDSLAG